MSAIGTVGMITAGTAAIVGSGAAAYEVKHALGKAAMPAGFAGVFTGGLGFGGSVVGMGMAAHFLDSKGLGGKAGTLAGGLALAGVGGALLGVAAFCFDASGS